jgi:HEAT repeat protein
MPQTTPTAPASKPAKPKPVLPPPEFQEGAIATMDAAGLIRILNDPSASEFQKAKACMRAGELGLKEAVPALAALLSNEHLAAYGRYGLEPIEDAAAADALRAALPKLKGKFLVGVIDSVGKRRDAKAAPILAKMIYDPDTEVAKAAATSLGKIGNLFAVEQLQAALGKTKGVVRMAVADGALICAERLLEDGKRDQAMALYAALTVPDMPKPARFGAMQGIIREETSIHRPR